MQLAIPAITKDADHLLCHRAHSIQNGFITFLSFLPETPGVYAAETSTRCDDAFSVLAFGANTFALTLVGLGGARTRDLFVGDSLLFLTSYLVLGKWIRDLLHWVAVGEGLRESFVDTMLIQSPISAAYAGLIGVVVIAISGLGWETVR